MPATSTPRRAPARKAKTPPKKEIDVDIPLGDHDNNSVRERVRLWQAQGGGVIATEDPYVDNENGLQDQPEQEVERIDKCNGHKSPQKHHTSTENIGESPTPKQRIGRRKDIEPKSAKQKPRSISAPRKRIVSDEHWVKDRRIPKPKEKVITEKRSVPAWTLADDGIRVRPMSESTPRRYREKSANEMRKKQSKFDDGIRVYSTPHKRRKTPLEPPDDNGDDKSTVVSEHMESLEQSIGTNSLIEPNPSVLQRSRETTPEKSPSSARNRLPGGKGRPSLTKKSRDDIKNEKASLEQLQRSLMPKRDTKKLSKGRILSNVIGSSKKIFAKNEPPPAPTPKVPRIESWLYDTPDPFLEDDPAAYVETAAEPPETIFADSVVGIQDNEGDASEEDEPPVEIPAPLKPSSKRRKRNSSNHTKPIDHNVTVSDPNGIWDSVSSRSQNPRSISKKQRDELEISAHSQELDQRDHQQETRKPRSKSPLTDIPDVQTSKPDLSPSALKRRGAKRNGSASVSPKRDCERKSSPLKEYFATSEVSTEDSTTNIEASLPEINNDYDACIQNSRRHVARPFPLLGKKPLSTIVSVESCGGSDIDRTEDTSVSVVKTTNRHGDEINVNRHHTQSPRFKIPTKDHIDSSLLRHKSSRNRSVKDLDLQSMLSLPRADVRTIRSSRSTRTTRSKPENATTEGILGELANDEAQYMRELQTLVDGVIPVLLSSVLSKSDAAIAAGLFSPIRAYKMDLTKPICDMGVALERLKRAHKRIPLTNTNSLLTWAHGTSMVYRDYLKAWRLGFQDVVVNLAPSQEEQAASDSIEESGGLSRNEYGDVVGPDGERVDVAYLLKRPLVRLKYLVKHLDCIRVIAPSAEVESLVKEYSELVAEARKRSNEERARIEDENAASIDPTRARDLKTLGPLAGVLIDPSRSVLARDVFDLTLIHSTSQRVDCKVEIFLRSNPSGIETDGDVLICEVDEKDRWLLFPPIQRSKISARNGDNQGEIIVMIRGNVSGGAEWYELLSFHNDDEETGFEWVQMLGLNPIPPKIERIASFVNRSEHRRILALPAPDSVVVTEIDNNSLPATPTKSRTPSPRELHVPIGEKASGNVKVWVDSLSHPEPLVPINQQPSSAKEHEQPLVLESTAKSPMTEKQKPHPEPQNARKLNVQSNDQQTSSKPSRNVRTPRTLNEALEMAGNQSSNLKRSKARRKSRHSIDDDAQIKSSANPDPASVSPVSEVQSKRHSQQLSKPLPPAPLAPLSPKAQQKPKHHRSSSVPSLDLPIIPKIRKDSLPTTPVYEPEEDPIWAKDEITRWHEGSESAAKEVAQDEHEDRPPPPPPHRTPSPAQIGPAPTSDLGPVNTQRVHRRISSPLKHEYEPSTATESDSESEASTVEHNHMNETPESSEEEDFEAEDVLGSLLSLGRINKRPKARNAPYSYFSPSKAESIRPSSSASQSSPETELAQQPKPQRSVIGSVHYWSETGSWESLYEKDCIIIMRGGIIEAFDLVEYYSNKGNTDAGSDNAKALSPIIGLEVTPVVPIRRGTAIDVTVRSNRATENSRHTKGDNYLFRTRDTEHCDLLYDYINWARLNNPVYMQLEEQWARERVSKFGGASFNNESGKKRGLSWFGRKRSYRASSATSPSINRSERSSGTRFSAMSIFKHLSGKSTGISIARSTITSRQGTRSNSQYSASDESPGSGVSTPGAAASLGPINMKIVLHIRDRRAGNGFSKRGTAFLTLQRPRTNARALAPGLVGGESGDADSEVSVQTMGDLLQNGGQAPAQRTEGSIRLLIHDKKGRSLIDIVLGKQNFYHYANRGVAFCVRQESEFVGSTGGVDSVKWSWFLIETATEAHAAWILQLAQSADFSTYPAALLAELPVLHE